MKKLTLLVMPLMTLSLLASCNKGNNNWWNKTKSLTKDDIGKIEEVKVNEQIHKVRLIDVDKDKDNEGNTIHTTWEFVNPISDQNGYSLATQWNDTLANVRDKSSRNYLNSSVRKALINEGDGHILWAQRGNDHWSNEEGSPYTNKSVLDMLPEELTKELKKPSKYINIWSETGQSNADWKEQIVNDKLFLLSPAEMGRTDHEFEEKDTIAYSYYEGHSEEKDSIRIKKQVNGDKVLKNSSSILKTAGQEYQDEEVNNYAGYNFDTTTARGARLWLRSPSTDTPAGEQVADHAWMIGNDGVLNYYYVFNYAFAVAPAFCI